jgi:thiamine biosynthesis lipoprotein ApbE
MMPIAGKTWTEYGTTEASDWRSITVAARTCLDADAAAADPSGVAS